MASCPLPIEVAGVFRARRPADPCEPERITRGGGLEAESDSLTDPETWDFACAAAKDSPSATVVAPQPCRVRPPAGCFQPGGSTCWAGPVPPGGASRWPRGRALTGRIRLRRPGTVRAMATHSPCGRRRKATALPCGPHQGGPSGGWTYPSGRGRSCRRVGRSRRWAARSVVRNWSVAGNMATAVGNMATAREERDAQRGGRLGPRRCSLRRFGAWGRRRAAGPSPFVTPTPIYPTPPSPQEIQRESFFSTVLGIASCPRAGGTWADAPMSATAVIWRRRNGLQSRATRRGRTLTLVWPRPTVLLEPLRCNSVKPPWWITAG
jgi:hypothetical protein